MARVRLFAAAAEVIGADELAIQADSVGELRDKLIGEGGLTVQNVITRCSLLLNGARAESDETPVHTDTQVDVLPPFAGG